MEHDPKELRESARWMMQNESRINCGNPAVLIAFADLIERHADQERFVTAIRNLCNGGPFDLTDSPKSFISNVQKLCADFQKG